MSDPAMTERKCVVFDTSTLVADPEALSAYPGCDIVLPLRVIEELMAEEPAWRNRVSCRQAPEIEAVAESLQEELDKPSLPGDSPCGLK